MQQTLPNGAHDQVVFSRNGGNVAASAVASVAPLRGKVLLVHCCSSTPSADLQTGACRFINFIFQQPTYCLRLSAVARICYLPQKGTKGTKFVPFVPFVANLILVRGYRYGLGLDLVLRQLAAQRAFGVRRI